MSEASIDPTKMTRQDLTLGANLAGLFSIRMLGIFLILPIYAQYMRDDLGSGGFMTGLFISSYALTQLIMQPLVGALSDRIGRKVSIIIGLILFIIGSLIIAFTQTPWIAILGRVIQGASAISSVILALTSDIVREEIRGKIMAIIGVGIGVTFGVSVVASQLLYWLGGGMAIFLASALLGGVAIFVTLYKIPTPTLTVEEGKRRAEAQAQSPTEFLRSFRADFKGAFRDPDINRLYVGALILHLVLTGSFTSFSSFLSDRGYGTDQFIGSWLIYLPSFFISLLLMFAFVGYAERFYRHRFIFLMAITLLLLSFIPMFFNLGYWGLVGTMILFFTGFNVMEASQPSLISRLAPESERGLFMGIFSSAQFIGAATGGMVASLIYSFASFWFKDPTLSYKSVFLLLIVILAGWLIYAYPMKDLKRKKDKDAEGDKRSPHDTAYQEDPFEAAAEHRKQSSTEEL